MCRAPEPHEGLPASLSMGALSGSFTLPSISPSQLPASQVSVLGARSVGPVPRTERSYSPLTMTSRVNSVPLTTVKFRPAAWTRMSLTQLMASDTSQC